MKYFQSFCKSIGANACYLLCLIDVAEEYLKKEVNKIDIIEQCIKKKYITFNQNNYDDYDNFYVEKPTEVLKLITSKNWDVRKETSLNNNLSKKEYVIEYWSIDGKSGHFARINKNFNSLQCSNNVKKGKIISYRICKVL